MDALAPLILLLCAATLVAVVALYTRVHQVESATRALHSLWSEELDELREMLQARQPAPADVPPMVPATLPPLSSASPADESPFAARASRARALAARGLNRAEVARELESTTAEVELLLSLNPER